VDEQKALNLTGRFEAFHLSLASTGRLMGVFGTVVQPFMLAMFARSLSEYSGDFSGVRAVDLMQMRHEKDLSPLAG
jgi:hypothetical protein